MTSENYHLTVYKIYFVLTFAKLQTLYASKLIEKKINEEDVQAYNNAFCASVAERSPIIFGSLLGFGSGRSFSNELLYFSFFFISLFSICSGRKEF
jgi:hypothetical protein